MTTPTRAEVERMHPPDKGRTHWEGCWRDHRDCMAYALLEALEDERSTFQSFSEHHAATEKAKEAAERDLLRYGQCAVSCDRRMTGICTCGWQSRRAALVATYGAPV
jgi:hypothetical protein